MELTTGESDEEDSKALEYNENSDTVLTHFEFLYHSKTLYQLIHDQTAKNTCYLSNHELRK